MFLNFNNIGPLYLTLVVTLLTWFIIALGAATVFLTRDVHPKFDISSIGFAAGILLSVALFSLILPASKISIEIIPLWFSISLGIFLGIFTMIIIHRIMPHHHMHHMHNSPHMSHHISHHNRISQEFENNQNIRKRNRLLLISLGLHHIPENVSLGIAIGAAYTAFGFFTLAAALSLAIALAVHNFPEGMAATLPLRSEGMSRKKSFFYGQSIGVVAPVAGTFGVLMVTTLTPMVPYAFGFAAGAILFIALRHLIPHIYKSQNRRLGALFAIIGFLTMMSLELVLG